MTALRLRVLEVPSAQPTTSVTTHQAMCYCLEGYLYMYTVQTCCYVLLEYMQNLTHQIAVHFIDQLSHNVPGTSVSHHKFMKQQHNLLQGKCFTYDMCVYRLVEPTLATTKPRGTKRKRTSEILLCCCNCFCLLKRFVSDHPTVLESSDVSNIPVNQANRRNGRPL